MTPRNPRWPRAALPKLRAKVAVIAHRGDHTQAPENTLRALENAIRAGADYVEVDLRTTRDGHIVVLHDRTVDRTTDGRGDVARMTLAEVRALVVRDPQAPADAPPERIPTFEEMLRAAGRRMRWYLDCKEIDPAQVAETLRRHGRERAAVVYDDPEGCAAWKKAAPWMPVMTSPPREATTPEALDAFLTEWPVEILDGPYFFYDAARAAVARRREVAVWPDIQNPDEGPDQWRIPLDLGATGLQSDHPGALRAWLEREKRR